ncbi:hypothetical protein [Psychromonas hadalis]|nr:hypothetical protein [Psychromonas hadalis]
MIDDLEHQGFSKAEKLLDDLSDAARLKINESMSSLVTLASQLS